jgi:CrcB protein
MIVLAAIVASGAGSAARYGLAGTVQRRTRTTRPWGTAVVNLAGALVLGLLAGLHATGHLHVDIVTVAGTGFCGGFTTFSTWMVESVRLGEEGSGAGLAAALVNVAGMLVVGVAAAALAMTIT